MNHIALVGDSNSQAADRLNNDYNFAGYPTVFYDGGDTVGVGGSTSQDYYRGRIEVAGARPVPNLDVIMRMEHISGTDYEVQVKVGNGVLANRDPSIPVVNGSQATEAGIQNNYKAISTDDDSDKLLYQFEFSDGTTTEWLGPFDSGDSCSVNHTWAQNGTYNIKVRTQDPWDVITDWSPLYSVQVGCCVSVRGNVDGDFGDNTDISDLVFLVDFIFTGGPGPICLYEGNVEGDAGENIDISDLVYIVDFIFTGGPTPPACP